MNEKTTKKRTKSKLRSFVDSYLSGIIAILPFCVVGVIILWFFFGKHIVAFFSPTPQHKCEASISSSATNLYCNEDGTIGNKKEDECLAKGSNYEYDSNNFTCNEKTSTTEKQNTSTSDTKVTYTCVDVTSYDNNYDNDMLCTSSTGKQIYTNYNHAKLLMNGDPSEQYDNMENYDSYDYMDF